MQSSERSFRTTVTNDQSVLEQMEVGNKSSLRSKYMTFGKRVQIFTKRAEELLFASMHMMVQENEMRIKYSLFGVLIDFLQVFAFTLSQDFGWGPEYDAVASVVLMPAELISWTVFQVIFWLAVLVSLSAFVVSYYVGYSFITSDFRVMWPIHYLRTIVNVMLSVLFIPVMTVLLLPLKSNAQGYLPQFADEGIRAWGEESTFYGVVAIMMLVIFIPYCLMMGLLNYEFSPNTKDIMSRHTSWLDFIYLIMKTLIVFVANISSDTMAAVYFRVVMLIIPTLFVTLFVLLYYPYYKPWVNVFRGALFGTLMGASFSTAIRVFSKVNPFLSFGLALEFTIHVTISIVVGGIVGSIAYFRLRTLLRERGNLFLWVAKAKMRADSHSPANPNGQRNSPLNGSSIGLMDLNKRVTPMSQRKSNPNAQSTQGNTRVRALQPGGIHAQMEMSNPGMAKRLMTAFKNFNFMVSAQLKVTFLQEGENDDYHTLAETVFQRSLDHKPIAGLLILYGNFLVNYKKDWLTSAAQIKKARAKGVGFSQRWQCYMVEKKIERERRAYSAGMVGSTDLMAYVEFQHLFHKAQRFHLEGLRELRHFWESILLNKGDKQLEKMSSSKDDLVRTQQKALMAYSRLISSNAGSVLVWRSYGSFLLNVADEKEEAVQVFQMADDIEERQAASRGKKLKINDGSIDDTKSVRSHLSTIGEVLLGKSTTQVTDQPTTDSEVDQISNNSDESSKSSGLTSDHDSKSQNSRSRNSSSKRESTNSSLRNAFDDMGNSKAITRLHGRFVQALVILFFCFVGNFVCTTVFIGLEDANVDAVHEVDELLINSVHASLAAQELIIDYYLNGSLTKDVTKWKILPHGPQESYKELDELLHTLEYYTGHLMGTALNMGDYIQNAWEKKAKVVEFPSHKVTERSIKDALDNYIAVCRDLGEKAADRSVPASDLIHSNEYPFFVVNQEMQYGGVIQELVDAYGHELQIANAELQYIVAGVLVAAFLIAGLLLFGIIQPTMKEVHLDEHLSEGLLTYLPLREVEKIVKQVFRNEREMMKQLVDSGAGGDSGADEEDLLYSTGKNKKKRKEKSHINMEVDLHNASYRRMKLCRQQRPLRLRYYFALTMIMALLVGNCVEMITTLAGDVELAKLIALSGQRMDTAATVFNYYFYIPDTLGKMMAEWEPEWRDDMLHNIDRLAELNNALIFGSTKLNVPNAYEHTKATQKDLADELVGEVSEFVKAMRDLQKMNGSGLTFNQPQFDQAHNNWVSPGIMSKAMGQSRQSYYHEIVNEHKKLFSDAIIWLIAQISALLLVYFMVVKYIVFQLRENIEITQRLIKMVPSNVIMETALLAEYLKDKTAFLERVKEKASLFKNVGELNDSWALAASEDSLDAHVITSTLGDILYVNRAALKMFGLSQAEFHHKKIEIIVAPAYRALVNRFLVDVAKKLHLSLESFMGLRAVRGQVHTSEQFCASMNVQYVVGGGDPCIAFFIRAEKEKMMTMDGQEKQSSSTDSQIRDVVFESVPAMVISLAGQIMEVNKPALRLLGATFTEVQETHDISSASDHESRKKGRKDKRNRDESPSDVSLKRALRLKRANTDPDSVNLSRGMEWFSLFAKEAQHDSRVLLRDALASRSHVAHRDLILAPRIGVVEGQSTQRVLRVRMEVTHHDKNQESRCFVAVLEDMTQLRSVEEGIEFAGMLSTAVLYSLPSACLVMDKNGILIHFNDAAASMWGFSEDSVVGRHHKFLFHDERARLRDIPESIWTRVKGRTASGSIIVMEVFKKNEYSDSNANMVVVLHARSVAMHLPLNDLSGLALGPNSDFGETPELSMRSSTSHVSITEPSDLEK